MEKKETSFDYKIEVPFREDSHCFMVKVEGTASFNAEGVRSQGWYYARFLNALQSGISLYTEEFLANTEHAEKLRREFFEVIEPAAKQDRWALKDVDLGIKSVKISEMNWAGKEEIENTSGWVDKRNKDFAEQYPQEEENEI